MAQFTIYTSGDTSAPLLTGTSGSLIDLLDACLVNGYGTKPGAGWTKPYENSNNYGCYQQGTGSMLCLVVRDDAITSSKEAKITGYESLTSVSGGTNPFPTAAQGVASQTCVIARKSNTTNATERPWIVFADSSSMYCFVQAGDTAGYYAAFSFGDFYSLKTTPDLYKCMIVGRTIENTTALTADKLDLLSALNLATAGHFIARSYSGTGTSITAGAHGDAVKGSATYLYGTVINPNPVDNGIYISPVWVTDTVTAVVRGRMRGFYQLCHPIAGFTDGQIITGSGDFPSSTFRVIKTSGNAGVYCIETSDTLETN